MWRPFRLFLILFEYCRLDQVYGYALTLQADSAPPPTQMWVGRMLWNNHRQLQSELVNTLICTCCRTSATPLSAVCKDNVKLRNRISTYMCQIRSFKLNFKLVFFLILQHMFIHVVYVFHSVNGQFACTNSKSDSREIYGGKFHNVCCTKRGNSYD